MNAVSQTISVLIPVYNSARFLREAIESVFGQTHTDWKLIIADDGSTDASIPIALEYTSKDSRRVQYVHHPWHRNLGISATRNLALAHARSDLIAFLDADDTWLPEKLQKQLAVWNRQPNLSFLIQSGLFCHPDGRKVDQGMTYPPGLLPKGALVPKILASDNETPFQQGMLMRRATALALGGYEERFPGIFEDQAMSLKISLSYPVYYDPEPLLLYRLHPESCCHTTSARQQATARVKLYSWLVEYLQKKESVIGHLHYYQELALTRLERASVEAAAR